MSLLSKRLAAVSNLVEPESRLADIGSDHAYLPVELVENKVVDFAIAGEVAPGPRDRSLADVEKYQLTDKIKVRLGDGLAVIELDDKIDTVVIAGMGGILISDILKRATEDQLKNVETLILQPNIGEPLVRHWLVDNNFEIVDEDIIEDEKHVYEIIKAKKVAKVTPLADAQFLMGPVLMKEKSPVFVDKWTRKLNGYQKAIANMGNAKVVDETKIAQMKQYIDFIKEVL